jgi:hypothetical protein
MEEQAQDPAGLSGGKGQSTTAQSAATGSPPSATHADGGTGHHDHDHDGDCLRICGARDLPKADAKLELRHQRLEEALHGPFGVTGRRNLNWNGRNQVKLTFESLEKLLDKALPPARPESDIPDKTAETKQAGS